MGLNLDDSVFHIHQLFHYRLVITSLFLPKEEVENPTTSIIAYFLLRCPLLSSLESECSGPVLQHFRRLSITNDSVKSLQLDG